MSKPSPEHYRPDIDGLRALAVLPVLLFHAKLGCTGGFVGVDMFFVISGYLISSIILKDLSDGTFSLIAFWERRIRRIFPALATVMFATFAAGWIYFLPEDFVALGQSIIAQMALLSNFFFYQQWLDGSGYFAPALDPKPLLHTWSLAVEEQFYLLFPLLLILLARWRRFSLAITLTGIAMGSFVLSVVGADRYPAAAFYLLPARAWELLLGGLLTLMRGRFQPGSRMKETAGWLGLGLVGYPIFLYDLYDPQFPGAAAIPPCLGTALILFSSETGFSFVGRILALKPLVFVGLISYPLYLWHWPLLVFAKYPLRSQSGASSAAMLLASAVLATLTWKFIETPFRKRMILPRRPGIFWLAGISTALLLGSGFFVIEDQGVPSRYSGKTFSYVVSRSHFAFRNSVSLADAQAGQFPEIGAQQSNQPVKLLIWGDSHAMAITPVLDELCRRFSWRGVQATHHSTPPVLGYANEIEGGLKESAPLFNKAVLDYIGKRHIENVVMAARWGEYSSAEFKTNLLSTVRAVVKLGARVYVIKDVPIQAPNLATKTAFAIIHHGYLTQIGITRKEHQEANRDLDQMFEQISQAGATVLDPADYFLNSRGFYGVVKDDQILYLDGHHITVEGSRLLAPLFEPIFKPN
jgi:peptidoglycan/LPS O-acetylase OafA/YrhL